MMPLIQLRLATSIIALALQCELPIGRKESITALLYLVMVQPGSSITTLPNEDGTKQKPPWVAAVKDPKVEKYQLTFRHSVIFVFGFYLLR
jgi:hypothetical protein